MTDIISELRTRIYQELPNGWSWIRKNDTAERILSPLRQHIEQICTEHSELDEAIDQLVAENQELRQKLIQLPLDTVEQIGYNRGDAE